MECGGFLTSLGYDVTLLVRSILLRGFDQEMAESVGNYMKDHGTKFVRPAILTKIEKIQDGEFKVEYKNLETGQILTDTFNTILMAVKFSL